MKEVSNELIYVIELLSDGVDENIFSERFRFCLERLKRSRIIKEYCVETIKNYCISYYQQKEDCIEEKFLKLYLKEYLGHEERKSYIERWQLFKICKNL